MSDSWFGLGSRSSQLGGGAPLWAPCPAPRLPETLPPSRPSPMLALSINETLREEERKKWHREQNSRRETLKLGCPETANSCVSAATVVKGKRAHRRERMFAGHASFKGDEGLGWGTHEGL